MRSNRGVYNYNCTSVCSVFMIPIVRYGEHVNVLNVFSICYQTICVIVNWWLVTRIDVIRPVSGK